MAHDKIIRALSMEVSNLNLKGEEEFTLDFQGFLVGTFV